MGRTGRSSTPTTGPASARSPTSVPAPHPVQDRATVAFATKERAETTITLYNTLGQRVRTVYRGTPTPGEAQTAQIETNGLSSGVYVLRLQVNGQMKTRRMTVVR